MDSRLLSLYLLLQIRFETTIHLHSIKMLFSEKKYLKGVRYECSVVGRLANQEVVSPSLSSPLPMFLERFSRLQGHKGVFTVGDTNGMSIYQGESA